MQSSINPGRQDWVLLFYYPVKAKNADLETITTMTSTSRKIKAEKMFKSSQEKIEGTQQVGSAVLSFRMADVRKSGFNITQEWQFDAYPISNVGLSKRFKVSGIEGEGRKNYVVVTGIAKDNE